MHDVDGAVVVVVVLLVSVLGPIWQHSRRIADVAACTGMSIWVCSNVRLFDGYILSRTKVIKTAQELYSLGRQVVKKVL